MYAKAVALSSVAALAGQAIAFNSHRHGHLHDKRALVIDWVTVIETITVTPGQEAAAAATPTPAFGAQDVTTTTSIVVPTTHGDKPVYNPPPAHQHTTLSTAVRPSSAAAPVSSPQAPPPPPPAPKPTTKTQAPPPPPPPPAPKPTTKTPAPAPAPQPTSSKAAPAPQPSTYTPPTGGAFGSKRGLAYNDAGLAGSFGAACGSKCGWGYNWGSSSSGLSSKYKYIPTLWGPAPEHSNGWDQAAQSAINSGSQALFSFNECDNAGQANMSPQAAATAHAQFMGKYVGKALISAPSITNSQSPGQGVDWLNSFVSACSSTNGCHFDICNTHWYSPATAIDTLFTQLEKVHEACGGKPVVLTEFAPFGSDEEIATFLKTALPKLDALPYLSAYSYFMVGQGSLMNGNAPSTYGQVYAST